MAKILVVEDNPDNRELMTYLLSAFGHEVATAMDGEQAVQALAGDRFDLVACDVHLPKMDGYQVVAAIKAQGALAGVPVIAVTALAMVGDRERLLEAGFDGYVSKPIDPQSFVGEIASFLPSPGSAMGNAEVAAAVHVTLDEGRAPATLVGRLLVIDDSAANRELLRVVLGQVGYQVTESSGVEEALAIASREHFDLILCDLRMPQRDGLEFLRAVGEDPRLRATPVLIVTASRWNLAILKINIILYRICIIFKIQSSIKEVQLVIMFIILQMLF
jgi:two-component system cell cycle response regulator